MKGLRLTGLLVLVLVVLAAGAWVMRARSEPSRSGPRSILVPSGHSSDAPTVMRADRIRVQVLNATKTRGLARRATQLLRDRGFDVVEMGTVNEAHDTTLVLDRSGHPEWAAEVAKVMGPARAEARPDSSRYLDVTVLVGRLWRPPAEPFYP